MSANPTRNVRFDRRHWLAASGALAGAAALNRRSLAQQTSPVATPAGNTDPNLKAVSTQLRYVHPEKVYNYLPGFQDEAILASLFQLDVATYRAARERFETAVHHTAMDMLAETAFADRVNRLPFEPGQTVIAIGESDMDDLQSSFDILRHLLQMQRPDDGIDFVNLAISGQASSEAVGRYPAAFAQHQPDWVICGLGGNDTLRNGHEATKTRVSIEETQLNLTELHHVATAHADTGWVWLTRWAIDGEWIAAFPPFQEQGISIRQEDWQAVIDFVRQQAGTVVDLEPLFGDPMGSDFLEPDGLHPTLAGQREIARALVEHLTA